ncbi:MAG: hypothetical protein ACRYHB_13750 [Janthinobacterium lividum]
MEEHKKPHLISADRLDGSVIITFDDGRSGLYSSAVLYAALSQARELYEADAAELSSELTQNGLYGIEKSA